MPLVPAAVLALALIVPSRPGHHDRRSASSCSALLWYRRPAPAGVRRRSLVAGVAAAVGAGGLRGLPIRSGAVVAATPAPTRRAPAIRPARRCSRWPMAACSVTGSGRARAKWNYLPNAHNDFIFAIIGEELGFVGCARGCWALFGLFAYTGMRIARRSADPFLRLLTADRHDVGDRPGVDQRRLRGRAAAGHRSAAAADLGGWVVNGDYALDVRHDGQRRAARARGGGRAAGRARGPGRAGCCVCRCRSPMCRPHRGPARPVAATARRATGRNPRANPTAKPAARQAPTRGANRHPADRQVRRSGHHGDGRNGAAVGLAVRKVLAVGRSASRVSRSGRLRGRPEDIGRPGRRRHRRACRTGHGRRRRAARAGSAGPDHRAGHRSAAWRPRWCPNAAIPWS